MNKLFSFFSICALLGLFACDQVKVPTPKPSFYDCTTFSSDSSAQHPKALQFEEILRTHQPGNLVGGVLLAIDERGMWQGAAGLASIEPQIQMATCHRFLIASISKVFSAVLAHALVDEGVWGLDDPIRGYLPADTVDKIDNADQVSIRQLLDHTAGIADYYTLQYELDRFNQIDNQWTQEDVLGYIMGKKATHAPGETYAYSNGNYLLLGILLERVTGQKLGDLYDQYIFEPLGLSSAYYSGFESPIPSGTAQGYGQLYQRGMVNSQSLYQDELKMADGGIAINAKDLATFYRALGSGQLMSASSWAAMSDWFELPEDYQDDTLGQSKNGAGLEYFETPYGPAYGHTGAVDGFLSIAMHYPESNKTLIWLINEASFSEVRIDIWLAAQELLFE